MSRDVSAWVFIFLFISSLVFVVVFGSAFLASLLFDPNKKYSRCSEWIPRKALKCSHCGSEQPQPIPRRFQPAKKFFLLFLVGFLGIAASVLWLMAFPPG